MSNMNKARKLMRKAGKKLQKATQLLEKAQTLYERAEIFTVRASPKRKAKGKHVEVTDEVRQQVLHWAKQHPNMTMSEIAQKTGLRNSGRVSEIINGLR